MQYDTASTRRLKAIREALQTEQDELVERTNTLYAFLQNRINRINTVLKGREQSAKNNNRKGTKRVSGDDRVHDRTRRTDAPNKASSK